MSNKNKNTIYEEAIIRTIKNNMEEVQKSNDVFNRAYLLGILSVSQLIVNPDIRDISEKANKLLRSS